MDKKYSHEIKYVKPQHILFCRTWRHAHRGHFVGQFHINLALVFNLMSVYEQLQSTFLRMVLKLKPASICSHSLRRVVEKEPHIARHSFVGK